MRRRAAWAKLKSSTGLPTARRLTVELPISVPTLTRPRTAPSALIGSSTVSRRAVGRPVLDFSFAHAARLRITVVTAGHSRRLASRRVRACNRYLIALPTRHGRANVTATAGGAWERRTVRY
jgi:hypothetical protein